MALLRCPADRPEAKRPTGGGGVHLGDVNVAGSQDFDTIAFGDLTLVNVTVEIVERPVVVADQVAAEEGPVIVDLHQNGAVDMVERGFDARVFRYIVGLSDGSCGHNDLGGLMLHSRYGDQ